MQSDLDDALSTADTITVGAGTATVQQQPMKLHLAIKLTVASGATLSVTNYTDGDLSDITNNHRQCHHCQFRSWLMTR